MPSLSPVLYDARGNRYVVASPDQIPDCPRHVKEAVASHERWAPGAITLLCRRPGEARAFSDGLIVGPFEAAPPFSILIVNTDGSLTERSGNGLTIFAQALRDTGTIGSGDRLVVDVHHATPGIASPASATLIITDEGGEAGVWVAMGQPEFGPAGVAASPAITATSTSRRATNHIAELAALNPLWFDSALVRVGNPHCVTWLGSAADLPLFEDLEDKQLFASLKAIAFAHPADRTSSSCAAVRPFANGINLQWAARLTNDRLAARIFERGEGPTKSSGSSATAVACTARRLGLATADAVTVDMPGGIAQVRFETSDTDVFTVDYLGVAKRVAAT